MTDGRARGAGGVRRGPRQVGGHGERKLGTLVGEIPLPDPLFVVRAAVLPRFAEFARRDERVNHADDAFPVVQVAGK